MVKTNIRIFVTGLVTLCVLLISYSGSVISKTGSTSEDSKDYTHTVMVEVGTATWCPSCPAANTFWHSTYAGGTYDFEYCEMVIDKNVEANDYMQNHYNLYWVPTNYFDGGAQLASGSTGLATLLNAAGNREVYDIDAAITQCFWMEQSKIQVAVEITNNEADTYDGTLRAYVIEKTSTLWNDYNGNDYYHAFLGFVFNVNISIPAGETYSSSTIWDGSVLYPDLSVDNCQVIVAVNNDEWHQGNSQDDPGTPDTAYFSAYYVDETVAMDPVTNLAPVAEFSYVPEYPEASETVAFTDASSDVDGTIVGWNWDFGDSGSSTLANPTHSYATKGYYTVSLTVEDDDGASTTVEKILIVTAAGEEFLVGQFVFDRGFPVRHTVDGNWGGAQNFTPPVDTITSVDLYLRKMGAPEFDLTVELREDGPQGTLHDTVVIPIASISTAWSWLSIDFVDTTVGAGSDVFIVLPQAPVGTTTSYGYEWGYAVGNQYDGGAFWFTRNGGGLWRDLPTMYEFVFCVYGS